MRRWLQWCRVDPNTLLAYEGHVRVHLIPHLGELSLDQLRVDDIRIMFDAIESNGAKIRLSQASRDAAVRASVRGLRPAGPSTCQRIWACPVLTDIRDQGTWGLREDVQHHGEHGKEAAAASAFVHAGVQGRDRRVVSAW
ncbi:hypothetical protein [Micromonospora sp. NBC_01796]|uniref:hypothetical protein n=1 Tax=Micromonospora sp. NBC_01796 TaxID=2975987 RepID=UPI003FA34A7E